MMVHKQRVDICNKTLMNSVHWGSLGAKNWHIRFENIEQYGSTGSGMKPFLGKRGCFR